MVSQRKTAMVHKAVLGYQTLEIRIRILGISKVEVLMDSRIVFREHYWKEGESSER